MTDLPCLGALFGVVVGLVELGHAVVVLEIAEVERRQALRNGAYAREKRGATHKGRNKTD